MRPSNITKRRFLPQSRYIRLAVRAAAVGVTIGLLSSCTAEGSIGPAWVQWQNLHAPAQPSYAIASINGDVARVAIAVGSRNVHRANEWQNVYYLCDAGSSAWTWQADPGFLQREGPEEQDSCFSSSGERMHTPTWLLNPPGRIVARAETEYLSAYGSIDDAGSDPHQRYYVVLADGSVWTGTGYNLSGYHWLFLGLIGAALGALIAMLSAWARR
jgi:hypothetical protein